MTKEVRVGDVAIGGRRPLTLIAGPCALESREICLEIGSTAKTVCEELGIQYIFKASFDKANRTSVRSSRGPGMDEGLALLAEMREKLGVPVLTDVHETWQADPVSQVADILQIPAFLCRQTDLLLACGNAGKAVNIKKGQFLAPADMRNLVQKMESTGNESILLTERGVSFGYGNLVVDMRSFPIMRDLGYPVVFDATHSVQCPGGLGTATGGTPEYVPHLVRAACGAGIDALFLEVHPEPSKALSDAATMLRLDMLKAVLTQAQAIDALVRTETQ